MSIEESYAARLSRFVASAITDTEFPRFVEAIDPELTQEVSMYTPPGQRAFDLVRRLRAECRLPALFRVLKEMRPLRHGELAELEALVVPPRLVEKQSFDRRAPEFVAEPRYIGSHRFVGRHVELEMLDDWAQPANPHPVLLFEAIGGTGKSMLTWHWTTTRATAVRNDWAGRFWYSFYERGAVMADFCQHALAYVTGRPLAEFRRRKTTELGELLARALQKRPFLLVLDGLERVLIAYQRFDAAQISDEQAGGFDPISDRDPCAAIRPEDDELLRLLSAAAPSKLLLTSRLVPSSLVNRSRQPIPGVVPQRLAGLTPSDAEELLRAGEIRGNSRTIQRYLQTHCDCHPLVTGVLAGLIHDYLPARGNFDAWAADPRAGGHLDLASLDLVQKRNHILDAAIAALSAPSSELLATLALLSEAVDYPTLVALRPIRRYRRPEELLPMERLVLHVRDVERLVQEDAREELTRGIRDLERRGLLQFEGADEKYDLHPVVRGVAAGSLGLAQKAEYGRRIVDHFSARVHDPFKNAAALADVSNGLHVVRALLQMGSYEEAYRAFTSGLSSALLFNLESYAMVQSLTKPFFPDGWTLSTGKLKNWLNAEEILLSGVSVAMTQSGEMARALEIDSALLHHKIQSWDIEAVRGTLGRISSSLYRCGRRAASSRMNHYRLALPAPKERSQQSGLFIAFLRALTDAGIFGRWDEGEKYSELLNSMGSHWPREIYRRGDVEYSIALLRFCRGDLRETDIAWAEQQAQTGKNRVAIRALHRLRGAWRRTQRAWELAATSYSEAARMAREIGQQDAGAEAGFALAQHHLGRLPNSRLKAERLAGTKEPDHLALAELWLAIGNREKTRHHALAAFREAWGEGEPYVFRWGLDRARELLIRIGVKPPNLPQYDPANDPRFPWEDEVQTFIENLSAEAAATLMT